MAESTTAESAAPAATPSPVITQGQTTSVGENTQALEEQPHNDAAAEQQQQAPGMFDNWLFYVVIALWVWYIFGNKKRRLAKAQEKKEQQRRESLQKGDNIVTIGRMHGLVVAFTDSTVTVKPDPRSDYTMTFERNAIARVMPRPDEEVEEAPPAK